MTPAFVGDTRPFYARLFEDAPPVLLEAHEDAEEFPKEHQGKRILRFDQVTKEMPAQLDAGRF